MGLDVFESIRAIRPGNECDRLEQSFVANLGGVLQSVGAMNAREGLLPVDGNSPPQDWDALIAHVRQAAFGPSEAETQLRQSELRAQTLLRSAHKRLDEAAARDAQAEARVRAAEAKVEAAEARARLAEEAARSALDWLQRMQQGDLGLGPAVAPLLGLRLRRAA